MKLILFIIIIFISNFSNARQSGETEIIAEDGIEVFQNEKYYLLKKNVKIESDDFVLSGNIVKIFFDKDLYDITKIDAIGLVSLNSSTYNMKAKGENIMFIVNSEEILISGNNSELIINNTEMYSDGKINVNNLNGVFFVAGSNSSIESEDILIKGEKIDGIFKTKGTNKDIISLIVFDENIAYTKSDNIEMFANKIEYDENSSIIKLQNNVKIVSGGETITGDYGTIDRKTNSYKIKSNDSKKVKVIISNNDE